MVLVIARSPRLQLDVARILARRIADFSAVLRLATTGGTNLEPHRYENVCYVFGCLETLLADMLAAEEATTLDDDFLCEIDTVLDDSLLHISDRFCLFAHYVWHIGGVVRRLRERNASS